MRNATQLANDAAADYFEKAHSSEGPDIIEELESTDLEALMLAQRSAAAANAALKGAVRAARRNGATWEAIGAILGITRQAAHSRFSGPDVTNTAP